MTTKTKKVKATPKRTPVKKLRAVAKALTDLAATTDTSQSAMSYTFQTQGAAITEVCRNAFGPANWDIAPRDIVAITGMVEETATWKGTTSAGARRSELIAIVKGYPFLGDAVAMFRDGNGGNISRQQFLKLARLAPNNKSAKATAQAGLELVKAKKKSGNKPLTPTEKRNRALKTAIDNSRGAVKKSLIELVEKHNIKLG